jgi:hypothetical protein
MKPPLYFVGFQTAIWAIFVGMATIGKLTLLSLAKS